MARQQAKKMNKLRVSHILHKHFLAAAGIALLQLVLRIVAFAPLFAAFKGVELPFLGEFSWVGFALLSALLYLFLVMPARYLGYGWLSRKMLGVSKPSYGACLHASLRRVVIGWLWGLPFLFVTGMFVYAYNGMSLTAFFKILTTLGAVVGGGFDAGIVLWVTAIVLFGLLFAWGWWRATPRDYVPLHQGVGHAWKAGKVIRRKHLGAYWVHALVNMLLTLPSLLLAAAIVGVNYVGGISFSAGAMAAAQQIMMKLASPLANTTVLYLCAVLLFVHLPLCVVRKLRMSALTCRLYKQHFDKEV